LIAFSDSDGMSWIAFSTSPPRTNDVPVFFSQELVLCSAYGSARLPLRFALPLVPTSRLLSSLELDGRAKLSQKLLFSDLYGDLLLLRASCRVSNLLPLQSSSSLGFGKDEVRSPIRCPPR